MTGREMDSVQKELESLTKRIADRNDPDTPATYVQHLAVTPLGNVYDLAFYGECFEESYFDLLRTVAKPTVGPHIRALVICGPDKGVDGTRNWDIEPLVDTGTEFSGLTTVSIEQNKPGDHNRTIVGSDYDEGGVIARLMEKAPRLQELIVPSAPNKDFFEMGTRPLRYLSVDAGYDTQNFISHLASSDCFPNLQTFEWGEYSETYMDDFPNGCTVMADYLDLFRSPLFETVKRFVLRNPVLEKDEIRRLKELRPGLQFLVVNFSAGYV